MNWSRHQVIECNLRASRSFPFVSKTFDVNFIELATKAMVGLNVKAHSIDLSEIPFVCCKAPMFSFTRLAGADPVLRVEMASTGEVACFGADRHEAFLKSLLATGFRPPRRNFLFSCGNLSARLEFLESARAMTRLGFRVLATKGTGAFLQENGIEAEIVHKVSSGHHPNVVDLIKNGDIDLVVNIPDSKSRQEVESPSMLTNLRRLVFLSLGNRWVSHSSYSCRFLCWSDHEYQSCCSAGGFVSEGH